MIPRLAVLIISVSWLVATASAATEDRTTPAGDLLIRHVTIVSAERAEAFGPVDVSIRAGRIAEMGPALSAGGFTEEQIIDGAGRFLTPGLIDSHVHLSGIPGMHGGHEAQFPDLARTAKQQIPRSYLYHGFTSVIDLIAEPSRIAAWNQQDLRPHAYFGGAAPIMDGYPTHRIPLPARYRAMPNFLHDPTRADAFPPDLDPAQHTPDAVVQRIASGGALAVKTFWEDGFGPAKNLPVPPPSVLKALVSSARARGLPVLLHANSEDAQRAGIEAGVDGIVHGLWTWDSPDAPELTAPITRVLDDIIAKGIGWQPTIQVLYGERDLFDPDYLKDPRMRAVVPQPVLDWHATDAGQWLQAEMGQNPWIRDAIKSGQWQGIDALPIRHVTQALSYLAKNGGRLLFGTDTPSAPTYANPAGLNGRLEMDRWTAAGVTAKKVFRAATLDNATFFKLSADIGTVEVGKRADLLLLSENPCDSITAYDRIELVILSGRAIPREHLAANYVAPPKT
jgi:imidazolonepropionase-like amidohydrolase